MITLSEDSFSTHTFMNDTAVYAAYRKNNFVVAKLSVIKGVMRVFHLRIIHVNLLYLQAMVKGVPFTVKMEGLKSTCE
jgi:hypothetical protein